MTSSHSEFPHRDPDDAAPGSDGDGETLMADLGWDAELSRAFESAAAEAGGADDARPARVARIDRGGWATALTPHGSLRIRQHPRFRRVMDPLDLPTVGDWVVVRPDPGGGPPLLEQVLPRRSVFARGDESHGRAQAVAANVDVVFLLLPATAPHNERRTDRMLSLAWASGARPVVVITKADMAEDLDERVDRVTGSVAGVPVHVVSSVSGQGIPELAGYLGPGRTVALLGVSGAGKSTLANRLLGRELLATGEVRRDGKGRHTTTHRQLLRLPAGGVLIDTPGLRSVGLLDREDASEDQTFADVEQLTASCRFTDCRHAGEPGCAVRAALDQGSLEPERWERYVTLLAEAEEVARRRQEGRRAAETRHHRARRQASGRRRKR